MKTVLQCIGLASSVIHLTRNSVLKDMLHAVSALACAISDLELVLAGLETGPDLRIGVFAEVDAINRVLAECFHDLAQITNAPGCE